MIFSHPSRIPSQSKSHVVHYCIHKAFASMIQKIENINHPFAWPDFYSFSCSKKTHSLLSPAMSSWTEARQNDLLMQISLLRLDKLQFTRTLFSQQRVHFGTFPLLEWRTNERTKSDENWIENVCFRSKWNDCRVPGLDLAVIRYDDDSIKVCMTVWMALSSITCFEWSLLLSYFYRFEKNNPSWI